MKFEYTGRHIEVTPALRSHVEQQFKRINHLFDGNSTKAHVVIEVERGRHRSEIIVNWRNETLTATSRLSDMYQSLSQSVAKIEKQAIASEKAIILITNCPLVVNSTVIDRFSASAGAVSTLLRGSLIC